MNSHTFATAAAVLLSAAALLVQFGMLGTAALAAPTGTKVDPVSGPNDLDTPTVITGTGFSDELSGKLVITPAMAYLRDTALEEVSWVSTTRLEAAVPWGPRYIRPPVTDTVYALACDEYKQGMIKSDDDGRTWESATEGTGNSLAVPPLGSGNDVCGDWKWPHLCLPQQGYNMDLHIAAGALDCCPRQPIANR
jgi:hypothetical protein